MGNSYITRAISTDGSVRIIFCDTTDIVKKASSLHNTSKTVTAVLGRALSATSMMSCLLKDKDNTLTLQIRGNGPCGSVVCVGDYMGNVRGYVDNPEIELPPNNSGKLNVGGAVGKGNLYIIKDMGMANPYIGISPLVSGEIAEDITEYFAQSEQTPSVCSLGVRVDKNLSCYAAGGYLVQLLPGYDDHTIDIIERNVGNISPVSDMIAEGRIGTDIINDLFSGIEYEIFDTINIDYVCNCSREKYLNGIVGLGKKDLDEILNSDRDVETECHFCHNKYSFTPEEIRLRMHAGTEERAEDHEKVQKEDL